MSKARAKASSGYRCKIWSQDGEMFNEALMCTYCSLLLKDPVQTSETGKRYCKECFDIVRESSDKMHMEGSNEAVWPDGAVKKEIEKLIVLCENTDKGCEWKGSLKVYLQHLEQCQYVVVKCKNTGCDQELLLLELKQHMKNRCPQRIVICEDCKETMSFIKLKSHVEDRCPKVIKSCQCCKQKMPAFKLMDHMKAECTQIRCVCSKEDNDMCFEKCSKDFYDHLQDNSYLSSHLQPLISHYHNLTLSVKEMTTAIELANSRIEKLEAKTSRLENHNKHLQNDNAELHKTIEDLTSKNVYKETNDTVTTQLNNISCIVKELKEKFHTLEISHDKLASQLANTKNQYRAQLEILNDKFEKGGSLQDAFPNGDHIKQVEEKALEIERAVNILNVNYADLELQLQASLASTYNGAFLWRIPEVRRRIRDAKSGRIASIYSPPFYTGRNGYKMCIRAYLNGDGSGEGTHLSIFFVLLKGEYDSLLPWPFEHKISLILVDQDQKRHLVQTFKPNIQSDSFKRPKSDMNVASGCPEFAELSILDDTSYVKNDAIYIKAVVDTSNIIHP